MISASSARDLLRGEGDSSLGFGPGDQLCHSNSALSRILKSGRGRYRRSPATSSNSLISARAPNCTASGSSGPFNLSDQLGSASIWSMAWSSSSKIVGLFMIAPHIAAQGLQGAELKLLDRSFRAPQLLRNFPQALLLHEPAEDHQALVGRKALDQLKQHGAALHFLIDACLFQIPGHDLLVPRLALPAV